MLGCARFESDGVIYGATSGSARWLSIASPFTRTGLLRIKEELPFLFRYEAVNKNYRQGHPDYNSLTIIVPAAGMPAIELLGLITQQLPGWQSTRFPSHLILYKEDREYTHGAIIWKQPAQ